ncbi:MAG: SDR family oxidoreductase [Bacteroidetes bacterium]|nr:SDR family oxidoreductase [Bacteroidota bacterium]
MNLQLRNNSKNPFTLITGASSGIGKAFAVKCAQLKMNLILVARTGPELKRLAESLKSTYNIQAVYFCADLAQKDTPKRLYEWCMDQKLPVNKLINNAGVGHAGPFEESTIAFYETMMQLNMLSLVKLTQLFIPEIKKHSTGNILNVGSMASLFPVPYKCVYAATKSFVLSFSKALREELKNTSIKVSCLCPGATITNAAVQARIKASGWKGKIFTMTSDKLAALTIKKFLTGKTVIIPSWKNKMVMLLTKFVPDAFIPAIAGKLFRN